MKKTILLILSTLMLAMTLAGCGNNNAAKPTANTPSKQQTQNGGQSNASAISSKWHGTYRSTDGKKKITLTIGSTGGVADIDGASNQLTAKADHGSELQLKDSAGNVYHLVIFADNPADKRYDFAVTEKDNSKNQIIGSTFMQRDGDTAAPEQRDGVTAAPEQTSGGSDKQNDDEQSEGAKVFPYIDITYKAPDYDGMLTFKKPDKEGNPTEIVIDGDTYILGECSCTYIADQDKWSISTGGTGTRGKIGITALGNNEKWMLWVSGALNMTSAYYGEAQSSNAKGNDASGYSFIGKVYKNEDLNLTFKLQTSDANGYPTEIVLSGVTHDGTLVFDNETYALENLKIVADVGTISILADWQAKGRLLRLNIQGDGDWWKMTGPGICSGYYYPV